MNTVFLPKANLTQKYTIFVRPLLSWEIMSKILLHLMVQKCIVWPLKLLRILPSMEAKWCCNMICTWWDKSSLIISCMSHKTWWTNQISWTTYSPHFITLDLFLCKYVYSISVDDNATLCARITTEIQRVAKKNFVLYMGKIGLASWYNGSHYGFSCWSGLNHTNLLN